MKRILYLRHAKSAWDNPDLDDFDRPLAQRGLSDAPGMGNHLKKEGYVPDLIISSPAKRAEQTAGIVARSLGVEPTDIIQNKSLYFTSARAYLNTVNELDDRLSSVMIVGHNPMIEEIVIKLVGDAGMSNFRMPTSAVACLEYRGSIWQDIDYGSCDLLYVMSPKKLLKS